MITEIAQQLLDIKKEVAEIEERHNEELKPKKSLLASLQQALIVELEKQGLKSIKTDLANFSLASRKGFTFTDEIRARQWAIETGAFSIDKRLAGQVLKDMTEMPDFIQATESNYLTIKETK
jgi:predicted nuclease with TOPRIM domain